MFRKNILKMSAYKPPIEGRSAQDYLLLDFNERVAPVSAHVKQALHDFIDSERLQKYPEYSDFLKVLAAYVEVPEEQLMITNGSDQGIDLIFRAVAEPGAQAIIPAPSFAMFFQCAGLEDMEVISPSYTLKGGYPIREVLSAANAKTNLIVICTPNNPTGTTLSQEEVLEIASSVPQAAILVDECYFEYCGISVKDFVAAHKNIFITRTFSKTWGLSSLRLGYLISAAKNIEQLLKIRGPYDMNLLSVVAARAALEKPDYVQSYVKEVMQESKPMLESYLRNKGIAFWPSSANFLLMRVDDPLTVVEQLKKEGILVRPRSGPNIENTVRITIGLKDDMRRLIQVLDRVL